MLFSEFSHVFVPFIELHVKEENGQVSHLPLLARKPENPAILQQPFHEYMFTWRAKKELVKFLHRVMQADREYRALTRELKRNMD